MRNLRTEQEIMANWKGDLSKPVVSVCCIAYNHEPYIEDALEGFLIQETDFPFEIIIHDDASTDKTADIIREYVLAYPNIIKPILQTENQYSKYPNKPGVLALEACQGEYIALCEGDDYWMDSAKLRCQVKSMCSEQVYVISAHDAHILNAAGVLEDYPLKAKKNVYSVADAIILGGGLVPSASIMLDRSIIEQFGRLLVNAPVGDWLIQVLATYEGQGLLFIDKKMSVYRSMTPGSWSSKRVLELDKFFSMLDQMDEYMNHQYSKEIYQAKKRLYYSAGRLALAKGNFLESRMYILKSLWVGNLFIKSVVVYLLSFLKIKV